MKLIINGCYKSIKAVSVKISNKSNKYKMEIVLESNKKLSSYDKEKFEDTIREILNQD